MDGCNANGNAHIRQMFQENLLVCGRGRAVASAVFGEGGVEFREHDGVRRRGSPSGDLTHLLGKRSSAERFACSPIVHHSLLKSD